MPTPSTAANPNGMSAPPPSKGERTIQPFIYPSVDPGFPALELDQLLGAHSDLLARIKICYGTGRAIYDAEVLPLIRRYAAFVHLLPATPSNYFNEPGGLLLLGLETAFYALQGTDAHIFSGRASIATRRHLEPRWRLATFIAGLCHEIERTLGQVIVTDGDGNEWPSYLQGLQPWLAARPVARYYLKWRPNAATTHGRGLFALPQIVPAETLHHLAQGNAVIVPHMMACLSGMPVTREHNVLGELVRRSAALVIDRFLRASADRYGKPQLGSHLERYLVDAIRRLVADDAAWTPNAHRSRVWYGSDGLYIVWPNAADDLRKLLEGDQLPGIPKSAETMLEILLGAGVFEAQADGAALWSIAPPGAKVAMEAVRMSDPAIALAGLPIAPVAAAAALAGKPVAKPPEPSEPAPVAATTPVSPPPEPHAPESPKTAPASKSPSSAQTVRPCPEAPSQPQQLELPMQPEAEPRTPPEGQLRDTVSVQDSNEACVPDGDRDARPVSTSAPQQPALRLRLPMRLAARMRDALLDIVLALQAPGSATQARRTPRGLFIAWSEFSQRGLEPNQAKRALTDARMLHIGPDLRDDDSSCEIEGRHVDGLTIADAFVGMGG